MEYLSKGHFVNFMQGIFSKSIPTRDEISNYLGTGKPFAESYKIWSSRSVFNENFSYAVPCLEALEIIKKYQPILEVGAGSGFWSSLLSRMGCDVIATDTKEWIFKKNHFDIFEMDAVSAVKKYSDRTILTCWPSYNEKWAFRFLNMVDRQTVIYIGESLGGCTACDHFHVLLNESFELIEEYGIPQWFGIHDYLMVYKKK